jgi:ABC-type lipoprotein release transport system permease subunit
VLFQTDPLDPVIYAAVAGLLLLVGLAAASVPARRASQVDPLLILRSE